LVIDDEVAISNNIRKILSKKGYQVNQAVTKNEALQKIEEKPYEIRNATEQAFRRAA